MSGIDGGELETRPGRTIAWTVVGDGPPLLLLNGYAATGADWDPVFLGALAAHHPGDLPRQHRARRARTSPTGEGSAGWRG